MQTKRAQMLTQQRPLQMLHSPLLQPLRQLQMRLLVQHPNRQTQKLRQNARQQIPKTLQTQMAKHSLKHNKLQMQMAQHSLKHNKV